MPHDKNGVPVEPNDIVLVRCRVLQVHQTDEYCNLSLETVDPMWPGDYRSALTLNAKQVEKQDA